MCFSPEVDLLAGAGITVLGLDAIRHIDHRSQRALATLPLIFGGHQLIEAGVWWSVRGDISAGIGDYFTWLYLALAFGVLPWFVPWAVRQLEPRPQRRAAMAGLSVLGALVSLLLMWAYIRGPVEVLDGGHYLAYRVPLPAGGLITAFYVLVTCGSLLLSSDRYVFLYGVVNVAAVSGLAVLLHAGLISLWCAWASVTSTAIAVHLRRTDPTRHRFAPQHAVG